MNAMNFFQSGDLWHIARSDGFGYCGIEGGETVDEMPANGALHLECREALAEEEQPRAEAENASAQAVRADEAPEPED